jgi:hypothetical protein
MPEKKNTADVTSKYPIPSIWFSDPYSPKTRGTIIAISGTNPKTMKTVPMSLRTERRSLIIIPWQREQTSTNNKQHVLIIL